MTPLPCAVLLTRDYSLLMKPFLSGRLTCQKTKEKGGGRRDGVGPAEWFDTAFSQAYYGKGGGLMKDASMFQLQNTPITWKRKILSLLLRSRVVMLSHVWISRQALPKSLILPIRTQCASGGRLLLDVLGTARALSFWSPSYQHREIFVSAVVR